MRCVGVFPSFLLWDARCDDTVSADKEAAVFGESMFPGVPPPPKR